MGKIRIDKDDISRVLLTELLPYEVPMLFSNDGFYSIVESGNYDVFFDKIKELSRAKASDNKKRFGIPFNYEISKNSFGDTRELSIIHPYNQFDYLELYKNYHYLMLNLCSKSPFSLRKIAKVAKYYYSPEFVFDEDGDRNADLEVEPDVLGVETKYLKSYFVYKPYDLIYKFYDKSEYRRLEQRFNLLMEFDISKCFYHIYTHSITWAVKGKEISKRNANKQSFENDFDKLMQLANYNETNGIIVGPEISRIFAEIILQQIDINVLQLLEKSKLRFGQDYEVRRYVDDYFIFSNDEKNLHLIKQVFQDELKFYKLYLNPNKTEVKTTPFISDITVGKRELHHFLESFYEKWITITRDENNEKIVDIELIRKPYSVSQNFIKDFQCIIKRNRLTYDLLSKDVIRSIKKQLIAVLKNSNILNEDKVITDFIILILDISFYAYSLNMNSNTTFKFSQILILIIKYCENKNPEVRHTIFSKINKETDFVLKNFQAKSKNEATNIEVLNLLIILKKLGKEYRISEKRLKILFKILNDEDYLRLNYFEIVTLLYYIDVESTYGNFKQNLHTTAINKFDTINPFAKSELTLLFFDYICCPFIGIREKVELMKKSQYCSFKTPKAEIEAEILKIANKKQWFMNWDLDIDLERVLKKKDWTSSY